MRQAFLLSAFLICSFSFLLRAEPGSPESEPKDKRLIGDSDINVPFREDTSGPKEKAGFSLAGRKRILDNIASLEQNIRDTKINMSKSEKNAKTIESELTELDGLEKEHLELKAKYQAYLEEATRKAQKNEATQQQLEKWAKQSKAAGAKVSAEDEAKSLKAQLDSIEADKAEQEGWRVDARAKVERVNSLLNKLLTGLRDIQERRSQLKQQLASWNEKSKGFQKLVENLTDRKAELETLASK